MKLLLFGSLAVLLGVVAWAALDWMIYGVVAPTARMRPPQPVVRFVNAARRDDGAARVKAGVWQTSTGPVDCAEVVARRVRDERKRIADLLGSATGPAPRHEEQNACAAFQLGEVEDGARVEVLGECGRMARIRILSGSLAGRQGCIETERLSADAEGPHWSS